jgi:restriction system protein
MAIPDFQTAMLPVLEFARERSEFSLPEAVSAVAEKFALTEAELQQLLPSGRQVLVKNRVAWAITYLTKAVLLQRVRRGSYRITDRGRSVLTAAPKRIDMKFLEQFPEYVAFRDLRHPAAPNPSGTAQVPELETPEEGLDTAYERLRADLEAEVLDQVRSSSPAFFERLVVELLVRMGYGGTLTEAGQVVGKSGDGGIDGIIKEDKLGLDVIYIQAKRWDATIGRPEIQKFAGALQGHRARKGVFITTSDFSREAQSYVSVIDTKIVLVDGRTLAGLMVDHNVGVSTIRSYEVKKIDSDYFIEE